MGEVKRKIVNGAHGGGGGKWENGGATLTAVAVAKGRKGSFILVLRSVCAIPFSRDSIAIPHLWGPCQKYLPSANIDATFQSLRMTERGW